RFREILFNILKNVNMRRFKRSKRLISLQLMILFFLMFLCVVTSAYAMDITLQWAPNDGPELAGYKVFYREEGQSYNYNTPYWECTEPECTVYDLDKTKNYYFVVRAIDNEGNTSGNSNEVALKAGSAVNNAGNGTGSGGGGGCFIATAAYGSLLEPHVRILRKFRDLFLLTNGPGKMFVKYYYRYSPPAAHFISRHAVLRALACILLLPLVVLSWIILTIGPGFTLALILLMGVSLVYIVRWRNNTVLVR
ncbi:MAG: fibronectin type III domain-containing protein, partial [Desulfobacterales bacterium]